MGSASDEKFSRLIQSKCTDIFGIPTKMKITSAHKAPDQTLEILSYYEGVFSHSNKFE